MDIFTPKCTSIGKITPSGQITEYPLANWVFGGNITTGPDGNLWFTDGRANSIGKITVSGQVTLYPVPTQQSNLYDLAAGPDGNLWFTEEIGKITPSGQITEYPAGNNNYPNSIISSPNGLWFLEPFDICKVIIK